MERLTRLEGKVDHLDWRMGQMDGRMDRLEGRMDGIDSRLRSVEVGIATLAERVAHLPSKGFIVAALLTGFAIMGALISFQDQIQGLLGIAP